MNSRPFLYQSSDGAALFIVLVFLVILTLLGMTAMQGASIGEKLARNELDYNLATQAAEAALRDAERDLQGKKPDGTICVAGTVGCRLANQRPLSSGGLSDFDKYCTAGQCEEGPAAQYTKSPIWEDPDMWSNAVDYGTYTTAAPLPSVIKQPQYLIELFRLDGNVFRITARGYGALPGTQVMLQSIYKMRP